MKQSKENSTQERKVVTSYVEPDIDGIGSMYAYVELLRKKRRNSRILF